MTSTLTENTTLTRIVALLSKAENTDNEFERDAYLTKAQEIATRAAIDLDRARFLVNSNLRKPVLIQKHIVIGDQGTHGLFTYVQLFLAIAHENNVKCNISQKSTYINAFGYDSDIEIVETLFVSLLHQMISASNAYLTSKEYQNETVWKPATDRWSSAKGEYVYKPGRYVPVHGKTARITFQEAFSNRIALRLQTARLHAEESAKADDVLSPEVEHQGEAQADSVALVLVRKTEAVEDFYKEKSTAKGSYRGGSSARGYSSSAASAGDSAGRSARLSNSTAIGGNRAALR